MPPVISLSEALTIWMSSTAMNAPRIAPKIAIQSLAVTRRSAAAGASSLHSAPVVGNRPRAPAGGAVRVSTVVVTDRPGRSCLNTGLPSSCSSILTGTRWTIFVKLPVAFSGGSKANCAPLPGAKLATVPCRWTSGKASTVISTCSPRNIRSICVSLKFATT